MSKINFFSLGGMDENERSCYVLEVDNNYYIFNMGITIPVYSKLGIKKIIPYIDWVEKNAKLIRGIFIGAASYRNIGAIQYIYDKIKDIPIYTSKIGMIILKSYLNKRSMQKYSNFDDLNINYLEPLKSVLIGNVYFTPFRVTTRVPDSYGFIISTSDGNIIYIDEFIINSDRKNGFINDITKINYFTKGKNLLLINNVGNVAKNNGFTAPNHISTNYYNNIITKAKNRRIIVGCFDTDLHTFLVLAELAKKKQIPFIIYNPMYMNVFSSISNEGVFNRKGLLILPIDKINEMKHGIVFVSSTPDRLFNKLISISNNEDNILKLKSNDKVILGFKISSGFEKVEAEILDRFSRLNIEIETIPKTILKMEASSEDHKFLVNELSPRYIIPTLGMYYEVEKYRSCLKSISYDEKNIAMLYNGEIFSLINGVRVNQNKRINVTEIYVGSQGILDEGDNILSERQAMSENGVIFYSIEYDNHSNQFNKNCMSLIQYGLANEDDETNQWIKKTSDDIYKLLLTNGESSNNLNIDDNYNENEDIENNGENLNPINKSIENKKIDFKEIKQVIKKYILKQANKQFFKTPIVIVTIL